MNINLLDAGFLVILGLFLVRGLICGMIQELVGLVGIALGFFMASRFYGLALPHLQVYIGVQTWAVAASYALVFVVVLLVVVLAGMAMRKFMTITFTAWLDHFMGGVVGAAKGIIVCAVVLLLLQHMLPGSQFLKASLLAPHIDRVVAYVRPFLPAIF